MIGVSLRLAIRSVLRRKLGLVLVVLPTAMLFGLLTFLLATEGAMRQLAEPGLDARSIRVGSVEGVSVERSWFTGGEVNNYFASIPGVEPAPSTWRSCFLDPNDPREFLCAIGTDGYMRMFDWEFHIPDEERTRWNSVKNGTIISRTMAAKHGWKVGDSFTLTMPPGSTGPQTAIPLTITYICEKYLTENFAWIHTKYFEDLSQRAPSFWVVWLLVDRAERRQVVMDLVDKNLNEIHRPHTLWTMEQSKDLITGSSVMLRNAFRIAGAFSFLLIVSVAVTLLILSIEQRTQELAALCAIGYRRSVLATSILGEGAFLLLPGAALGALAVWLKFHHKPLVFDLIFRVHVSWTDALTVAVGGTVLGLLAAVIPAVRVLRIDVLQSLR